MSKNLTALIACLFLLVGVIGAQALSEDFSATSGKTVYIGECSTGVDKILIQNTGDITSSYTITIDGTASRWASIAPSTFVLKAGESKQVFLYIKTPCKALGIYSLDTYITTKLGVQKVLEQEIEVKETQNAAITPVAYSRTIDPCETAVFEFDIKNTGDFPDTYNFSSEPFSDSTVFSQNNIIIPAGETSRVSMIVTPACDIWGNYSIKLTTNAKLSRAVAETEAMNLKINRSYDFSLSFGNLYTPVENKTPSTAQYSGAYSLCEYESGAVPVFIKNKAKIPNTYHFELEGEGWTSLSGDVATLAPGQLGFVNINVAPPMPMRENSTITLKAVSELGGIEKTESRGILVDICHIPVIAEDTKKIKTYYEESYANLSIENTGSMATEYQLAASGADWISLQPESIELAPGEKGSFYLHLNPANETAEGKYPITISAGVACVQSVCANQYLKDITVSIKDPRFMNMILDEYLPFTLLFIVLLIIAAVIAVFFVIHLENTKEERAKAREQRRKEQEKRRLEREKAKEKLRLEKEKIRLAREKEKEKRRLAKLKEKERRRLEKEKKKAKKKEAKFAASKKISMKQEKPKSKFGWGRIIFWTAIAAVILFLAYAVYIAASNIILYQSYLIYGAILAAAAIILLIIGDLLLSRWYKEQVWKTLVPNQKGVILLSWRKGLGEIVIKLKRLVEDAKISVKKHFWRPTFVAAGEKVYQYFEVKKKNFENRDIEKVSFRFRVKKSWLSRNSIPEESVRLVRYNNEQWVGITTKIVSNEKKYIYYEANTNSCSLFAIIGKPKIVKQKIQKPVLVAVKTEKKAAEKKVRKAGRKVQPGIDWANTFRVIGFAVLALIILGLVGYGVYYAATHVNFQVNEISNETAELNETQLNETQINETQTNITSEEPAAEEANETAEIPAEEEAVPEEQPEEDLIEAEPSPAENETNASTEVMPEPEEEEAGIPTQVWDEDTAHTVELSKYFQDPDNDALTYTYTPLEHIIIEITGDGIATLTPERNWNGNESVVFTADDGKGGNASSNRVKLVVNDVEEPPFAERLKEGFSLYSNYVMIGVLILVILILLIEFRKPIMKFLEED